MKRRSFHLFLRSIIMVSPVRPQTNFDPRNLPPGTTDFYNPTHFAASEMGFLATQVSQEQQAQERGLNQIKDAINGNS
jgi:hypothetical protein